MLTVTQLGMSLFLVRYHRILDEKIVWNLCLVFTSAFWLSAVWLFVYPDGSCNHQIKPLEPISQLTASDCWGIRSGPPPRLTLNLESRYTLETFRL